jgi:hypothetical protein
MLALDQADENACRNEVSVQVINGLGIVPGGGWRAANDDDAGYWLFVTR